MYQARETGVARTTNAVPADVGYNLYHTSTEVD
jgi:hypothetical protein